MRQQNLFKLYITCVFKKVLYSILKFKLGTLISNTIKNLVLHFQQFYYYLNMVVARQAVKKMFFVVPKNWTASNLCLFEDLYLLRNLVTVTGFSTANLNRVRHFFAKRLARKSVMLKEFLFDSYSPFRDHYTCATTPIVFNLVPLATNINFFKGPIVNLLLNTDMLRTESYFFPLGRSLLLEEQVWFLLKLLKVFQIQNNFSGLNVGHFFKITSGVGVGEIKKKQFGCLRNSTTSMQNIKNKKRKVRLKQLRLV